MLIFAHTAFLLCAAEVARLPGSTCSQATQQLHSVDLEVWSKLAKRALIKLLASKFTRDFDCDWQRINVFSYCVTLTRVLLPQIISYSIYKRAGSCGYGM